MQIWYVEWTNTFTNKPTDRALIIHTHWLRDNHTEVQKYTHTHSHSGVHTHTHTHTHSGANTHTASLTHTHTHTHTQWCTHTHTHTQWHTHTHTHTHACMHVQFPLPAFAINICHTMFSQRIWNKWEFCTVRWEEEESSKQLDQNNTNYIPRCRIWKKWALPDKKRRKVPSSMTLSTLLSVVKDLEEVVRWWAGDRPKWRDPVIMIDSFQTGVTSIRWR